MLNTIVNIHLQSAIFNITPSPGGSSCIENAEIDMRTVVKHLGATIDETALQKDLLGDDHSHEASDLASFVITEDHESTKEKENANERKYTLNYELLVVAFI